jgi:phosphomannomutase
MATAYIFDVDGTLTPSRQSMDKKFAVWFKAFCNANDVYLVTGSDRPKTIEQIGEVIYNSCQRVYNCSGNDVWEKDNNVYSNTWELPSAPMNFLRHELNQSKFKNKNGEHFEIRPGMLNFSIPGRGISLVERQQYVLWDRKHCERENIAEQFNSLYKHHGIISSVGGETGLDIFPVGCDKSQILKDFDDYDELIFFGDRCDINGNDFSIAHSIQINKRGKVHHVKSHVHTANILKNKYSNT